MNRLLTRLILIAAMLITSGCSFAQPFVVDKELSEARAEGEKAFDAGDFKAARKNFLFAFEKTKGLPQNHPEYLHSLEDMVRVEIAVDDPPGPYHEGRKYFKKMLDCHIESLGSQNPIIADDLRVLARTYNDPEDIIPLLDQAYFIQKNAQGDSSLAAGTLIDIGGQYERLGQWEKAGSSYLKAANVLERALGARNKKIARLLADAGRMYLKHKSYRQAEDLLTRADTVNQQLEPVDSHFRARVLADLGDAVRNQGRYREALKLYVEAMGFDRQILRDTGSGRPINFRLDPATWPKGVNLDKPHTK